VIERDKKIPQNKKERWEEMTYEEYLKVQEKEITDFPLFFAFNNEQFEEGAKKVGASPENKVVSIGAGGFIPKKNLAEFLDWSKNKNKRLKTLLKQKKFFSSAVYYELNNHEYCITYDLEESLSPLGLDLENLEDWQKESLQKAKDAYLANVI
jgi:hypothetical protein